MHSPCPLFKDEIHFWHYIEIFQKNIPLFHFVNTRTSKTTRKSGIRLNLRTFQYQTKFVLYPIDPSPGTTVCNVHFSFPLPVKSSVKRLMILFYSKLGRLHMHRGRVSNILSAYLHDLCTPVHRKFENIVQNCDKFISKFAYNFFK